MARLIFALMLILPVTAFAGDVTMGDVTLRDGWFRMLLPGRPAGGYFELENGGDEAVELTGVRTMGCGMAMLHETMREGGQDQMEMIHKIRIEPGESLSFAPGGFHIMCLSPQDWMVPGSEVPVFLRFASGDELEAMFEVRGALGD